MDDKLQRVVEVMYEYRQKGVGLEDKAKSIVQMFEDDSFAEAAMATNFGRRLQWGVPDEMRCLHDDIFLCRMLSSGAIEALRFSLPNRMFSSRDGRLYRLSEITSMAPLPDLGMDW